MVPCILTFALAVVSLIDWRANRRGGLDYRVTALRAGPAMTEKG